MLIRKPDDIPSREITPQDSYVNRRRFMRAAVMAGSMAATAGVYRLLNTPPSAEAKRAKLANIVRRGAIPNGDATRPSTGPAAQVPQYDARVVEAFDTDEPQTPLDDITHYNNFYEFTTDKQRVAYLSRNFVARPWQIKVGGLCRKPRTFDIDDLLALPQEQRVYRMRCVEAWSMVIPWFGFPLATLLNKVEPTSAARYVRFETLFDPARMPNQRTNTLKWPYVEGLRIDEAMHPLTLLATGIYGEALAPQNGAPLRLVVPWKYGFKGIKSIVKIQLVGNQPLSTWVGENSDWYGFYSNVNPQVSATRWSQASENRIGDYTKRPTLMFNGYGEQVAQMYAGMDLSTNY